MIAHINIGSNIGHRAENIDRAVAMLQNNVGQVLSVSQFIESAAWGFDSSNMFLNAGVNVETALAPSDIVKRLKAIESEIDPTGNHRKPDGTYADRVIDLDLICLENCVTGAADATVPHPHMHEREFVLLPLAELLPDWVHPVSGMTAAKILETAHNKNVQSDVS